MARNFRGGNRRGGQQNDDQNGQSRQRHGGIQKQDRPPQRRGKFYDRRVNYFFNTIVYIDINWKRDQEAGARRGGRNGEPMSSDKLDKQIDNYWTKHGKINKVDSNIYQIWFLYL